MGKMNLLVKWIKGRQSGKWGTGDRKKAAHKFT
jgi:hypothetical protein